MSQLKITATKSNGPPSLTISCSLELEVDLSSPESTSEGMKRFTTLMHKVLNNEEAQKLAVGIIDGLDTMIQRLDKGELDQLGSISVSSVT